VGLLYVPWKRNFICYQKFSCYKLIIRNFLVQNEFADVYEHVIVPVICSKTLITLLIRELFLLSIMCYRVVWSRMSQIRVVVDSTLIESRLISWKCRVKEHVNQIVICGLEFV
jgi:hypothetical protein